MKHRIFERRVSNLETVHPTSKAHVVSVPLAGKSETDLTQVLDGNFSGDYSIKVEGGTAKITIDSSDAPALNATIATKFKESMKQTARTLIESLETDHFVGIKDGKYWIFNSQGEPVNGPIEKESEADARCSDINHANSNPEWKPRTYLKFESSKKPKTNLVECEVEMRAGEWVIVDEEGDQLEGPFASEEEAITRAERLEVELSLEPNASEHYEKRHWKESQTDTTTAKAKQVAPKDNVLKGKNKLPEIGELVKGKEGEKVKLGKAHPDRHDAVHAKLDKEECRYESRAAKLLKSICD